MDDNLAVVGPQVWRGALALDEQRCLTLPGEFSSERDAERAMTALEQAGLTNAVALRHAGRAAVRQIMVESLAW
ncbi:MAG TPA: hypothetical protein PKC18_12240 [Lacipirellulaceae bacterium]|mgnify:CR=1 FL=1|nr:hypothetical protein [Lacipirellulaceae bacterium]HMP08394.1 hypothetical protein [Lacipirellulaceae bacterium]